MGKTWLCAIADIKDNSSKGFSPKGASQQEVFVVRRNGQFFAYRNHCPHTGVTLNWQDDQFMDVTQAFIQCSVHGAMFRIEDGVCLRGPCANRSLIPIAIEVIDGQLYLLN